MFEDLVAKLGDSLRRRAAGGSDPHPLGEEGKLAENPLWELDTQFLGSH